MSGKNAITKSRTTIQTQLPPNMQANAGATDVQLASSEPGATQSEAGSRHVADTDVLKLEILSSLKEDIVGIIKKELQDALVPAQLAANKAATDAILTTLKVHEGPNTCTTTVVAALLKETLGLDNEPRLDRSHRTAPRQSAPGERTRPRAIICRLLYYSDCVDILRRARERGQIKGARYGLFYPARLRITYGGAEKEFTSADDAGQYVKTMTTG
uniref:Uncharacterized protein n=1 Tax=Knipowitschia caucasica TaxID=637954 RepID=A0AAV2KPJ3_KNICA